MVLNSLPASFSGAILFQILWIVNIFFFILIVYGIIG